MKEAKERTLTPEELEKHHRADARELEKWKRERARKRPKFYLPLIVFILCLVRMIDDFSGNVPGSVQTWVINEFFVAGKGMTYEQGLATYGTVSNFILVLGVAVAFFGALSDRFGRKKMLLLSVVGMGAGILLCANAQSFVPYISGYAVLFVFTCADMHQLYIMETAPADKRGLYVSLTCVVGCAASMMIGLVRTAFTHDEVLSWRAVYLVPGFVAIACVVLIIVFARETDTFLDKRIEYLSTPYEKRLEAEIDAKKAQKENAEQYGIRAALKYVFSHKATKGLLFAYVPQCMATVAYSGYYETIMVQGGMTTSQVNTALFIYPLAGALIALLVGIGSDKLGRRPTGILTAATAFVFLFLFIFVSGRSANPYIVGILYGIEMTAFGRYGDTLRLVFQESVPTQIRASSMIGIALFSVIGSIIGNMIPIILVLFFPVATVSLVWGGIMCGLSAVMFIAFAKETKGINLNDVK